MKRVIRIKSPLIIALGLSMLLSSNYVLAEVPGQHPAFHSSSTLPASESRVRSDSPRGLATRPPLVPPRDSPLARYYPAAANDADINPMGSSATTRGHTASYSRTVETAGAYTGRHPAHADLSPQTVRHPPRDLAELEREIALNRSYLACNPTLPDPACSLEDGSSSDAFFRLSSARYPYLPRYTHYEWQRQGRDLLLVESESSSIYARFIDMIPR